MLCRRENRRVSRSDLRPASEAADDWVPGVPIDRRRDAQRLRASRSVLGDFEHTAARVMAKLLGERVELIDDGSSDGLVDICIRFADNDLGYVEVVVDMDPRWARTASDVRDRHYELAAGDLSRRWWIWVARTARLSVLEPHVVPLLAQLEEAGLVFERPAELDTLTATPEAATRLVEFGVIELTSRSLANGEEPAIHLRCEGTGGYAEDDWDGFLEEVARLTRSSRLADCRSKLRATGSAERHLFIGTTFTSKWSLNFWLGGEHTATPDRAPGLPEEVTHLWLWGPIPSGRVLAWFPDRGWFDPHLHWATK